MALISVLTMSSILLMMVISLYLSARGGLFSSISHQRRTQSLYTAEAGLADTMEALEAVQEVPGPEGRLRQLGLGERGQSGHRHGG
ncbi:hypothetical protein DYH09_07665 [bacterium CPR1]|nr:hypothetical protein [bacterium CPR1]